MKIQQIDCLFVTETAMWPSLQCMCRFTVMCRLTIGICSEKCVVRRFHRCANVIECTYTNLDRIAYYTPRLCGLAYCSLATNLNSTLLHWGADKSLGRPISRCILFDGENILFDGSLVLYI